jgi:hypothetical protein
MTAIELWLETAEKDGRENIARQKEEGSEPTKCSSSILRIGSNEKRF